MNDLRFRFKDLEVEAYDNEKVAMYQDALVDFKSTPKRNSFSDDKNERESGRLRKLFNRMKSRTSQNLKREMELESDYSSDDADNENANEHNIEHYSADNAQKSRELYARYVMCRLFSSYCISACSLINSKNIIMIFCTT